jgi:sphinganine-1-phosphate aldolase
MPELRMLGDPHGPLLACASRDPDVGIFAVGDQMDARGWQVSRLQFPEGLHHAATYGLMAKIPLRGMVRHRVLDIFAGRYTADAAEPDPGAVAGATDARRADAQQPALLAVRLGLWVVQHRRRRQG